MLAGRKWESGWKKMWERIGGLEKEDSKRGGNKTGDGRRKTEGKETMGDGKREWRRGENIIRGHRRKKTK